MLGFGCIVLNTWEGILMLFALGFQNGGPSGLLYGYIITWIGTLCIFVTLSELASMAPTSGGQYYWCSMLGPRSIRKSLSYITGWLTVCGWQGGLTSAFLLTGSMLQALIGLNTPTYVPHAWHALLLMYAFIVFAAVFNTLISNFLPAIEGAILVLHIVGFFAIMIPVVYLAPERNASAEVFQLFMNQGGWPTQGISFCLGIISTVFIFLGADSVFHVRTTTRLPFFLTSICKLTCVDGRGNQKRRHHRPAGHNRKRDRQRRPRFWHVSRHLVLLRERS